MDVNHQWKAKRWFRALAKLGPELPREYGKPLRDGIWELRVIIGHHQHRFLYGFWNDVIIVTNAFLKKSWEVPPTEIERAVKALAELMARRRREIL